MTEVPQVVKPQEVRNLAVIAMTEKTFTVVFNEPGDYQGNKKASTYTGSLELEGSFAMVREWEAPAVVGGSKTLKAIHVFPASIIHHIDWTATPVVSLPTLGGHRA